MTESVHPDGVTLVQRFEGLRLSPYLCPAQVWTIGYGATYGPDGRRVTRHSPSISEAEADVLLARDLSKFAAGVDRLVSVSIGDQQRAALTSFAFNLGLGALKSSTLLRRVNGQEWDDVPAQFRKWVFGGGRKLPGLVARREAEVALWLS